MSLIIENQYFPCVNWINTLFQFSNIKIEQYDSYQKMSFRNRCEVADSNGVVNLSVPLEKGRNQRQLMKEVKISYRDNWNTRHWRTIESCYSRSPFFEFYRDGVFSLLQQKPVFLLDQNLLILDWLKKALKFEGEIMSTGAYLQNYPEGTVDLRDHFLPKNSREGAPGLQYTQVFEDRIGFIPNLSILDLLFCTGPGAINLLKNNKLTF